MILLILKGKLKQNMCMKNTEKKIGRICPKWKIEVNPGEVEGTQDWS